MSIDKLLLRAARIEDEIEALKARIAAKTNERQAILDQARAELDALTPRRTNGVGRGNHTSPRGPVKGTPNTKQRSLTDAQVREMRALHATGKYSQRELGEMFGGLAQPVVNSIIHRRTYQDVT